MYQISPYGRDPRVDRARTHIVIGRGRAPALLQNESAVVYLEGFLARDRLYCLAFRLSFLLLRLRLLAFRLSLLAFRPGCLLLRLSCLAIGLSCHSRPCLG